MEKSQRVVFDINKVTIGTRVVTRDNHLGRIDSINLEKLDYPVSAIIELDGKEVPLIFTKEGHFYSDGRDSMFDLFLEEEKIENQESTQPKKQYKSEINDLQSKDNIPNGAIVYEDFNGGEGFYKVHLDYLNKEQVEIIKYLVKDWNKQEKQKSINNDTPKFKVGDWVVTNDDEVHQVKTVTNYGYMGILDNDRYLSSLWTDMYHFWTIQDAKPGDILYYSNSSNTASYGMLMFKELAQDETLQEVRCYCEYDIENGFFFDVCIDNPILCPASTELCKQFFQIMKEEEYEWDAENKELKKIDKEDKRLKQINKEVKSRFMTNQELSDWLYQCPEEHREFKYKKCITIYKYYSYYENEANTPVNDILIRRNHDEWQEPLIEI